MKISRKNKIKSQFIIFLILSIYFTVNLSDNTRAGQIANLILQTTGGGVLPDYSLYIAQYIRDIDIDLEIKIERWSVFYGGILPKGEFDLAIIEMDYNNFNPLHSDYFSVDGSKNYFFTNTRIPYINESEEKIDEIYQAEDRKERKEIFGEWQQLVMDCIVPCLPLFNHYKYISRWSNIEGFDIGWSLANNMPYLSFNGTHEGQEEIDELNIRDECFVDINPLILTDEASKNIVSFLFEPLIQISPENELLKTGLIYDWEEINPNYYTFFVRDDVYWNPSYNITERDEESPPLNIISTPLMSGLKGDLSNGENQKVTARDIVFTLLSYASEESSEYSNDYKWIKKITLDPMNNYSFSIEIDANPETAMIEYFQGSDFNFLFTLNIPCLPEFFLNSSAETITYTSGNIPVKGLYNIRNTNQWEYFSKSAFGCGKYMIDYIRKNSHSVLQKNPNWHGIGPREGKNQDLEIDKVVIRVIPDISASLAEFKAGKLDLMDVSYFTEQRVRMQTDTRFEVQSAKTNKMSCLIFNLNRPIIGSADNYRFIEEKNKEDYTRGTALRKAICYSINREEMNFGIHDSKYSVVHSPMFPSFSYYYNDDIIKYDRDLDLAEEWLNAAGYELFDYKPPRIARIVTTLIFFWSSIFICSLVAFIYCLKNIKKLISSFRKRLV